MAACVAEGALCSALRAVGMSNLCTCFAARPLRRITGRMAAQDTDIPNGIAAYNSSAPGGSNGASAQADAGNQKVTSTTAVLSALGLHACLHHDEVIRCVRKHSNIHSTLLASCEPCQHVFSVQAQHLVALCIFSPVPHSQRHPATY